jgi:hypothetical protein
MGKTFGTITQEDFAEFDKANLSHPSLSRMERTLKDLHKEKRPNPTLIPTTREL